MCQQIRTCSDDDDGISWDKIEQFERGLNRLRLLLNSAEPASRKIIEHAQQLLSCAQDNFSNDKHYHVTREAPFSATSLVLKEEWERIKKGQ